MCGGWPAHRSSLSLIRRMPVETQCKSRKHDAASLVFLRQLLTSFLFLYICMQGPVCLLARFQRELSERATETTRHACMHPLINQLLLAYCLHSFSLLIISCLTGQCMPILLASPLVNYLPTCFFFLFQVIMLTIRLY